MQRWSHYILRNREVDAQMLETAVKVVNRRIHIRAGEDASLSGMGTTLTCAWFDQKQIYIAHVGDSRCTLSGTAISTGHGRSLHGHGNGARGCPDAGTGGSASHAQCDYPCRRVGQKRTGGYSDTGAESRRSLALLLGRTSWTGRRTGKSEEYVSSADRPKAADALLRAALDAGAPDNVSLVLVLDKGGEA